MKNHVSNNVKYLSIVYVSLWLFFLASGIYYNIRRMNLIEKFYFHRNLDRTISIIHKYIHI